MKKSFVKYFGVASTTLLAVSPVITPALTTASNLQVVKADTIQDNINSSFKADNSIVPVTDSDWDLLTKDLKALSGGSEVKLADKAKINQSAQAARAQTAQVLYNLIANWIPTSSTNITAVTGDKLAKAILGAGTGAGTITPISNSTPTSSNELSGTGTKVVFSDEKGSLVTTDSDTDVNAWLANFNTMAKVDSSNGDVAYNENSPFGPATTTYDLSTLAGRVKAANKINSYINNLPLWWFVSDGSHTPGSSMGFAPITNAKGKSKYLDATAGLTAGDAESYITSVPKGGTASVTLSNDPSLSYVGDNVMNLQKASGTTLTNLLPSDNGFVTDAGVPYSSTQAQFVANVGIASELYLARPANEGSKAWNVILKSVMGNQYARKSFYDSFTGNVVNTKMLINGKDATQSQFVTKNEIKNADKFSVQFVFDDNAGRQWKSPLVWLSHNAHYTVDTSALGNIVRRPGDYYNPASNLTGTDDKGNALDPNKFVVVPAGTDINNYTHTSAAADTDSQIDLSALSELTTGVMSSNGLVASDPFNTSYEGSGLTSASFWTNPNYYYSKTGTYSDAVDIYYIGKNAEGTGSIEGSATAEAVKATQARTAAQGAAITGINSAVAQLTTGTASDQDILDVTYNAIKDYVDSAANVTVPTGTITHTITDGTSLGNVKVAIGGFHSTTITIAEILNSSRPSGGWKQSDMNASIDFKDTSTPGNVLFNDTLPNAMAKLLGLANVEYFGSKGSKGYYVESKYFYKLAANAGRTTKVEVPSKYLPQLSLDVFSSPNAGYVGNGSVVNNWYNYTTTSGSATTGNKNPYWTNGGWVITGNGSASSSASSATSIYRAPATYTTNQITQSDLKDTVLANIKPYLAAKLSNPNTATEDNKNGYFNAIKDGSKNVDPQYAYLKNGSIPASDINVDTSSVDFSKAGDYQVKVTYTPLSSLKANTQANGVTTKDVVITDNDNNLFKDGKPTSDKFMSFSTTSGATSNNGMPGSSTGSNTDSLNGFSADQIFANGAATTIYLPVKIVDGSSSQSLTGAPVIAFTNGGQNTTIAKGSSFSQYKDLQIFAYPGAAAWNQSDSSVKVSVSGQVDTNTEGTYTLVYTVTNSAGKTSTLTRVITVGSGKEVPTESAFNLSPAYISYVPGYNVREYSSPRADWSGQQLLHGSSVSVTTKATFNDGQTWYKLSDGMWVESQYVASGNSPETSTPAVGVATVTYVPGYAIAVYKNPGTGELVNENGGVKRLPNGTAWKTLSKKTVNGITYYNVGGNQWVDGRYVSYRGN